jgi:hypothetical protein
MECHREISFLEWTGKDHLPLLKFVGLGCKNGRLGRKVPPNPTKDGKAWPVTDSFLAGPSFYRRSARSFPTKSLNSDSAAIGVLFSILAALLLAVPN